VIKAEKYRCRGGIEYDSITCDSSRNGGNQKRQKKEARNTLSQIRFRGGRFKKCNQ